MTVSLFAGLRIDNYFDPLKKIQKVAFVPTQIPLNLESHFDRHLETHTHKINPEFPFTHYYVPCFYSGLL